jgi:hypothetical protein
MNYNIPARKIFLEDAISKDQHGVSILHKRQKLADKYYLVKRLFYLSCASLVTSAYLIVNKRYTNRQVYMLVFAGSAITAFMFNSLFSKTKEECLREFNCEDKLFNDYVRFYKYALLDDYNHYEADKSKH